jgi:hypothetical protein
LCPILPSRKLPYHEEFRLPTEYFAAKEKPSSSMSAFNVKKKEQVRNIGDLGQLSEA